MNDEVKKKEYVNEQGFDNVHGTRRNFEYDIINNLTEIKNLLKELIILNKGT